MLIQICGTPTRTEPVVRAIEKLGHLVRCGEEIPEDSSTRAIAALVVVDGDVESSALCRLRQAAARFSTADRPTLVAVTHTEARVAALLDAGADDWLLWPVPDELLAARLRVARSRTTRRRGQLDVSQIGRELHEGIGQLLSSATHILSGLASELPAQPAAKVERARELLGQARECVRTLAAGLSTAELVPDPRSFLVTLEEAAARARALFDIECVIDWTNLRELPCPRAKAQLSLIVGEAIDNAVRHGGAGHVTLSPRLVGDRAVLCIHDNGGGLPEEVHSGLGLRGMRRRARAIGGGIELSGNARSGTTVRVVFSPSPMGPTRGPTLDVVRSATEVNAPGKDEVGQPEAHALAALGNAGDERRVAPQRGRSDRS